MASVHSTEYNIRTLLSEFTFFWDFSPPSLTTLKSTVFRSCILWVAEVLSAKSTIFRRLRRLQGTLVPKIVRIDFMIKVQRPKSIVAVAQGGQDFMLQL